MFLVAHINAKSISSIFPKRRLRGSSDSVTLPHKNAERLLLLVDEEQIKSIYLFIA